MYCSRSIDANLGLDIVFKLRFLSSERSRGSSYDMLKREGSVEYGWAHLCCLVLAFLQARIQLQRSSSLLDHIYPRELHSRYSVQHYRHQVPWRNVSCRPVVSGRGAMEDRLERGFEVAQLSPGRYLPMFKLVFRYDPGHASCQGTLSALAPPTNMVNMAHQAPFFES